MNVSAPIRIAALPALLIAVILTVSASGQTIPAAAPTTAPTTKAPSSGANQTTPALQPAHRADIQFATGQLSIKAENSSLNQILRDVGRLTGMKITGGVNDERVYGNYGPADTSTVLSALLRGTGSNMMIVFDDRQAPQELVLTPRGGGPTPPNPSANRGNDREEDDLPPQRRGARMPRGADDSSPRPAPGVPQTPPEAPVNPAPEPASTPTPAAAAPAATTDTTTQSNPNDVKTPQQIYEQLMQMQQQQQKTGPPPTPPQ